MDHHYTPTLEEYGRLFEPPQKGNGWLRELLGFAKKYFSEPADAEDAVFSAIESVWKDIAGGRSYDSEQALKNCLFEAVRFRCLNILRKRRSRHYPQLLLDQPAGPEGAPWEPPSSHPDPSQRSVQSEESARLGFVLDLLSEDHRRILVDKADADCIRDNQNPMSDAERMNLFRARKQCRACWKYLNELELLLPGYREEIQALSAESRKGFDLWVCAASHKKGNCDTEVRSILQRNDGAWEAFRNSIHVFKGLKQRRMVLHYFYPTRAS